MTYDHWKTTDPNDGLNSRDEPRRHRLEPGKCSYCDAYRDEGMCPSHDASEWCKSGKHEHCTCDTCF